MLEEYTFDVLQRTRNILRDENKRLSQYEYELSLNCFQFGGEENLTVQPIILKKQINLEKRSPVAAQRIKQNER